MFGCLHLKQSRLANRFRWQYPEKHTYKLEPHRRVWSQLLDDELHTEPKILKLGYKRYIYMCRNGVGVTSRHGIIVGRFTTTRLFVFARREAWQSNTRWQLAHKLLSRKKARDALTHSRLYHTARNDGKRSEKSGAMSSRGIYHPHLSLNYPTLDRYEVETPRFPFGALNYRSELKQHRVTDGRCMGYGAGNNTFAVSVT